MAQTDNIKLISNNKKAYHDFFIEEKFEAGIELYGTEIKSVRMGNVNLKDSWISIKNLSVRRSRNVFVLRALPPCTIRRLS